jgi:chaperone modulatory protein CbpM
MVKKELLIIADYSKESFLTLEELCDVCGVHMDLMQDFISNDIIKPSGDSPEQWVFDLVQLQRIQTALRLQRDFEVNVAGAALALDLLDEMKRLRAHTELLERYFSKIK